VDQSLPFPRRGLNDNWAFGVQPSETTRDAQNMRGIDPTNGRVRGAQRAGMSKHIAEAVGTSPVRVVRSAVFDAKTITFTELQGDLDTGVFDDVSEVWAVETEPKEAVLNLATDLQGNVYALTGKTIEKRNPDSALLWSFPVPVDKADFTLGPLLIGEDLSIYTAIDGGTPGAEGATIFKIEQVAVPNSFDTEPVLAWGWQVDRFVRELRLYQSTLKCLLQDDVKQRSHVMTLVNLNLAIPSERGEIEVPYPSTCMVTKADGSIVTGHPFFADRDSSPAHPGVGISLEEWTSADLDDYKNRVWSKYDPQDLVDLGIGEGEDAFFWVDQTGNGRNLVQSNFPQESKPELIPVPTLRLDGSTGFPSVQFSGGQGLFSASGGGTDAQREACKTMVPNHGDGAYCIFIVCRPSSQKTPAEKDASGNDVNKTRWLFQQFTHTTYQGDVTSGFDTEYTEAHRSGLIVNSAEPSGGGTGHYTWSTKNDFIQGESAPGFIRAFTPSSGQTTGTSNSSGSTDSAVMPTHVGAGFAGWPKQGLYDDSTTEEPGEGLCLITFMNCGGLDEAVASTGDLLSGTLYTAHSPDFEGIPPGATGVMHSAGLSDTVTAVDATRLLVGLAGNIPTGVGLEVHIVWERNFMSRSLLRINGEPVDRWESLPMAYAGVDSGPVRNLNLNVESNPTGLGNPLASDLLPFLGEIMDIEVFGRRQKNADRVTLGGTPHVLYPAVLDHPFYAANGHVDDTNGDDAGSHDKAWENVGTNLLSSEMEKIEGAFMHKHGISKRLPKTTDVYAHPHHPESGVGKTTYDIPIRSNIENTGQAWMPRKRNPEAMIVKHDQSGKMIWCLLADVGTGFGDIVSEDLNGNTGVLGVTNARSTSGLAVSSNGNIYFAGPGAGTPAEGFAIGEIVDAPIDAENPRLISVGWGRLAGDPVADEFNAGFAADEILRLIRDEYDNLYVPFPPGTQYQSADAPDAFRSYGRDLPESPISYMYRLSTLGDPGGPKYQNLHAVALPPVNPLYFV